MTATRRHRAPDRIAVLEQQVDALTAETARLQREAGKAEPSILRGIQDATALAEAHAAYGRLEAQRNREVEQARWQIADLTRRLAVAARAEAAGTATQPITVADVTAGLADRAGRSIRVMPLWDSPLAYTGDAA